MRAITFIFFIIVTLCLLIFLFTIPSSAVQTNHFVTVDDEGDGDFRSLQNAIDQVTNNTSIYVYSGIYPEQLTIDKPVTIIGKNHELGSGSNTNFPVISGQDNYTVITILADDVIIEQLNITRGKTSFMGGGISLCSQNCTIKNNIIYDNKYGLIIKKKTNMNLTQNIIESNFFIDNEYGLDLFYNKETQIKNNYFKNCSVSIYGNHILHFYHHINNNLINNLPLYYATNSESLILNGSQQQYGEIILINCTNATIKNMNITKATTGLEIAFSNKISIENNIISHCQNGLYDYHSSMNTINNNSFSFNKEIGILLHDTKKIQIRKNMLNHNFDGIRNEFSTENTFIENIIVNNNNNGIYLRNTTKSEICQNFIQFNSGGIYAYTTTDEHFNHNFITSNFGNGLLINKGLNTDISSNTIKNNTLNGIELKRETKQATISNNSISHNFHFGIYITDASNNNKIYHNFFRSNGNQFENGANAYDECINVWNLGYPSNWLHWEYLPSHYYGGNYWQDHSKIDTYKGPLQDKKGSDNIIDQSYKIAGGNNVDKYPILPIGKSLYVDKTGQADYKNIQQAINIAKSKTTIYVKSGVYNEQLVINNPVSLIGNKETIIEGNRNDPVIIIDCNSVTLSHCTIQHSGPNEAAIVINSDNNNIVHNTFSNNTDAIQLISSSSNHISNNTIIKNDGIGIDLQQNSHYNTLIYNTISYNYKGVKCISTCKHNLIQHNSIKFNELNGIELASTSKNQIYSNDIEKNNPGILLSDVSSSSISKNDFKDCGIIFLQVKQQPNNSIKNNTVNGKPLYYYENEQNLTIPPAGQIILVNCTNCLITNQEISNTCIGIELWNSSQCILTENILSINDKGIYLVNSNLNSIQANSISECTVGILCYDSSNNLFKKNNIQRNKDGIRFLSCQHNHIINSNIKNNLDKGIELFSSSLNQIIDNTFLKNEYGLYIEASNENQIMQNKFIDNDEGTMIDQSKGTALSNNSFLKDGLIIQYSTQNSIQNNTVNEKPLIYYEDRTDIHIKDAGQIILINCSQINVKHQYITNTPIAIQLEKSSDCVIYNNSLSHSKKGILLNQSTTNTISENTLRYMEKAIVAYDSNQNEITKNNCLKNSYGIILTQSDKNTITHNTIKSSVFSGIFINVGFHNQISDCLIRNNEWGIALEHAIHTSIENNTIQKNFRGVLLSSANHNQIIFCQINNNYWGIKLESSQHNFIEYCTISESAGGIIRGKNNNIQRNNFINNGLHSFGEPDKKNRFHRNYWDTHQNRLPYLVYAKNIDWMPKSNPYDFQEIKNVNSNRLNNIFLFFETVREKIKNVFTQLSEITSFQILNNIIQKIEFISYLSYINR